MSNTEQELKDHLIDTYRNMVADRYDYDKIKDTLPEGIDHEVADSLRFYFLTYLYPPAKDRHDLDEAFEHLENYVKNPAKVWGILGNIAGAIFRFGNMLIDALKAGLVSLDTQVAAKEFENNLYEAAMDHGFTVPLNDTQFRTCIRSIPRKKIDRFIDDLGKLFHAMSNTRLLGKTVEIMRDVVKKMEKRPRLYTKEEIQGIELGISILNEGYELFKKYDSKTKQTIVAYIIQRERAFTAEIYGEAEE